MQRETLIAIKAPPGTEVEAPNVEDTVRFFYIVVRHAVYYFRTWYDKFQNSRLLGPGNFAQLNRLHASRKASMPRNGHKETPACILASLHVISCCSLAKPSVRFVCNRFLSREQQQPQLAKAFVTRRRLQSRFWIICKRIRRKV